VTTLEGVKQTHSIGPMASQEVIKELGHQWRRFMNAKFGASFREPERMDQYPRIFALLLVPVLRCSPSAGLSATSSKAARS